MPCKLFHVVRYPILVFLQLAAPNDLAEPRFGPLKLCEPHPNSREDWWSPFLDNLFISTWFSSDTLSIPKPQGDIATRTTYEGKLQWEWVCAQWVEYSKRVGFRERENHVIVSTLAVGADQHSESEFEYRRLKAQASRKRVRHLCQWPSRSSKLCSMYFAPIIIRLRGGHWFFEILPENWARSPHFIIVSVRY